MHSLGALHSSCCALIAAACGGMTLTDRGDTCALTKTKTHRQRMLCCSDGMGSSAVPSRQTVI